MAGISRNRFYTVMNSKKIAPKTAAVALTADNIYDEILKANNELDNAVVSETGRIVYDAFVLENKAKDIYYQANKTTTGA